MDPLVAAVHRHNSPHPIDMNNLALRSTRKWPGDVTVTELCRGTRRIEESKRVPTQLLRTYFKNLKLRNSWEAI
jgi:hypothetical protein